MRRRLSLTAAVLTVTALALAAPPGRPAGAQAVSVRHTQIFPGLHREVVQFRLDDGRIAVANVLSFAAADPLLELKPVLAQDRVPGLETVVAMGHRQLPRNGVAGINGGFWLRNPLGDPNSFLSLDGRLVSEAETQGAGPRGTFAVRGDRHLVMDRLATTITLEAEGAAPRLVTAVNRFHRGTRPYPDDTVMPVYLYTPDFGGHVTPTPIMVNGVAQPMIAVVVDGLIPRPSGKDSGSVAQVLPAPGQVAIPAGGTVVVAHGRSAAELAALTPGAQVSVNVSVRPADSLAAEWEGTIDALAAGPLLVRRGERVNPADWENEGFSPATHNNVRHPRSAVALTFDGRVLMVTVDGRQPGYSAGMTMHELAHFLRTLGAKDGLSLDGGGSTQFVTDGVLRNRPCCDASLRPVATGLFVFHRYTFQATERIAGSGREATAAQVALAAHPTGADEVLLASAAAFPDALAGGPLAHDLDAPLLLTGTDSVPAATEQALATLKPDRVTILGGTSAVGEAVEASLRQRYAVRRLAGEGRVETAVAIAEALDDEHPRVFLARADRFPDALSAAAPGGALGMPILLTASDHLAPELLAYLRRADVEEVVILGGESAVAGSVAQELRSRELAVTRLAGKSRFGTAAAVNRWFISQMENLDRTTVVVAAGGTFPDALAGAPLAASRRQLLMIAPTQDIEADAEAKAFFTELASGPLGRFVLIGGHGVLSSNAQWQLDSYALR